MKSRQAFRRLTTNQLFSPYWPSARAAPVFSQRLMSATAYPQGGPSSAGSSRGADDSASSQTQPDTPASTTSNKPALELPEPPKDGSTIELSVGGEGVKLDHLGPLVVNENGTMSRISNWSEMSEIERQNTVRILGKRNQSRLKKLREGME